MPKLSVIVPVYNVAPFLPRCLDSILAQSFQDLEIVAVDDGSTDACPQILADYAARHPKILRIFTKENGGLSDARNFGLARAQGEYVAFVDSDDTVHPDFARLTVEKMEKEGLDLLLFDFSYAFANGTLTPARALLYGDAGDPKVLLTASPMAWLRVYRKELLPEDPFCKGLYYEDLDMTPRMLLRSKKAGYLPRPLYDYCQREGSIMKEGVFSPKWLDIFTVMERLTEHFRREGLWEVYRDELEFLYTEHLLRSAALRFVLFPQGRKLIPKLAKTVAEQFPAPQKNPYLARTSLFFRITVFCTRHRITPALYLLARLKG